MDQDGSMIVVSRSGLDRPWTLTAPVRSLLGMRLRLGWVRPRAAEEWVTAGKVQFDRCCASAPRLISLEEFVARRYVRSATVANRWALSDLLGMDARPMVVLAAAVVVTSLWYLSPVSRFGLLLGLTAIGLVIATVRWACIEMRDFRLGPFGWMGVLFVSYLLLVWGHVLSGTLRVPPSHSTDFSAGFELAWAFAFSAAGLAGILGAIDDAVKDNWY
jgi:hypothetical protein